MIVDFHSHILPRIDDGSQSVEESIAMLKEEAKQGITHVVATPHFYADQDHPEKFLKRRKEAEMKLKEAIRDMENMPSILLGAEVLYFNGISQWQGLKDFVIEGTNYVMIEMPMPPWSKRMLQEIDNISAELELIPMIAHIDRYIRPFKTYGIPDALNDMDVLVQANASFFSKGNMGYRLLSQGKIHLLGSDCHNMDSRPPNLGIALSKIERKLGKKTMNFISENEKKVLGHIK